ncbi:hypothetical protein PSCICN_35650 [Pseudomonas cichorii]|uniref:hypothetical protein n=1 Tax=Pseudomonas cichorii TaxID=36746 RepID=UPI0019102EF1|nr:hypothetical protein [Pseudomonas cichorii]GFM82873.1 hypothetical protein PSCICN_35650 [Pseudomonas cichorii]
MQRFYSSSTGCTYLPAIHGDQIPADAVEISEDIYTSVIANPPAGKVRSHDESGLPILIDPVQVVATADELCEQIDAVRLVGTLEALRVLEYSLAVSEAQAFKAAGYPVDAVPRAVAAYAINGRTPQEAAEAILQASADTADMLYQIREARLAAKESVRALVAAGEHEQAKAVVATVIDLIRELTAGSGGEPLKAVQ